MNDELERSLRFRNYAEELRVIAPGGYVTDAGLLEMAADEYDQMATSMEAIEKAKRAYGLKEQP